MKNQTKKGRPWLCSPRPSHPPSPFLRQGGLGLAPLGWQFRWKEGEPTRVLVVRKSDMSVVADTTVPSMSLYHFAGAYEARKTEAAHTCTVVGFTCL